MIYELIWCWCSNRTRHKAWKRKWKTNKWCPTRILWLSRARFWSQLVSWTNLQWRKMSALASLVKLTLPRMEQEQSSGILCRSPHSSCRVPWSHTFGEGWHCPGASCVEPHSLIGFMKLIHEWIKTFFPLLALSTNASCDILMRDLSRLLNIFKHPPSCQTFTNH